jgi:hypothetical protein
LHRLTLGWIASRRPLTRATERSERRL